MQTRCDPAHSVVEEKGKKGNHQNMRQDKIRSKWRCLQCVAGTQRKNELTLSWDSGEAEFPVEGSIFTGLKEWRVYRGKSGG